MKYNIITYDGVREGLGLFLVVILLVFFTGCESDKQNGVIILPKDQSVSHVERGIRTYFITYEDTLLDVSFSFFQVLAIEPDTLRVIKMSDTIFSEQIELNNGDTVRFILNLTIQSN